MTETFSFHGCHPEKWIEKKHSAERVIGRILLAKSWTRRRTTKNKFFHSHTRWRKKFISQRKMDGWNGQMTSWKLFLLCTEFFQFERKHFVKHTMYVATSIKTVMLVAVMISYNQTESNHCRCWKSSTDAWVMISTLIIRFLGFILKIIGSLNKRLFGEDSRLKNMSLTPKLLGYFLNILV